MQAARLRFFVDEIRKDSAFATHIRAWTVYVRIQERWTTEDSQTLQDDGLSQRFDNLLSVGKHWHPAHSHIAYFPIQQLSRALALSAAFTATPGSFSVDMVSDTIREVLTLDPSPVSRAHRVELQAFLDTLMAPKTLSS